MKVLRSRLFEAKQREQESKIASERRSQVGTGDRSERIRTYNYPQSRVSDHRIGLTLYHLEQILNGDLDQIIDPLITADRGRKAQGGRAIERRKKFMPNKIIVDAFGGDNAPLAALKGSRPCR